MSTAQNSGWALGLVGSGKLTKSTVTWPITPFSYSTSPIALLIVIKFIYGKLVYGKKQPALLYSFAANLSKDPINSMFPSGSKKKAIDGDASELGGHIGAASITPPILQKCSIYSSQFLNKVG